jgi:hypothetical protein
MNLKNLIKDLPAKNINSSDLIDIINYVINIIIEVPVQETIEVGDWVINKIDEKTFYISERYSSSDMSRYMHDEFCRKKLIKVVDKL